MVNVNTQLLDSNASLDSGWISFIRFDPQTYGFSIYAKGIESGGTVAVYVSNTPNLANNDAEVGFKVNTLTPDTNGTAVYLPTAAFNYYRFIKSAGSSPTQTILRLFGNIVTS